MKICDKCRMRPYDDDLSDLIKLKGERKKMLEFRSGRIDVHPFDLDYEIGPGDDRLTVKEYRPR